MAVFQNYVVFTFPQQWMFLAVLHSRQQLVWAVILDFWQLVVALRCVLMCISVMTKDAEHLFMCLSTTCVFSMVKCLSQSLARTSYAYCLHGIFFQSFLSTFVFVFKVCPLYVHTVVIYCSITNRCKKLGGLKH